MSPAAPGGLTGRAAQSDIAIGEATFAAGAAAAGLADEYWVRVDLELDETRNLQLGSGLPASSRAALTAAGSSCHPDGPTEEP